MLNKPLMMIFNRKSEFWTINMLRFGNFNKFAHLTLIFKCQHHQTAQVFHDLVVLLRASDLITCGVSNGNCKLPLHKSLLGQTTFSAPGINMWNSLPTELGPDPDLDHFKLKLKQLLKRDHLCTHEWSEVLALCCSPVWVGFALSVCSFMLSFVCLMYRLIVELCTVSCQCDVSYWVLCILKAPLRMGIEI